MIRCFILAAAACAALAGAARAEEQVKVSTKGVDLSTSAGAKLFYSRLSQAVVAACGGAPTSFFTSEEERFQACYKAAMDQAVAQAQAPLVTALRAGKATALAVR